MTSRVEIHALATGVEGLDDVLGGGVPELSFNLIAGGPGCGKTTLAHQIMFAIASPERPALYVTVLGEPPLKMLRYQQRYTFFDEKKIGTSVRFLHLGAEVLAGGLELVLERIVQEVEATSPSLVLVDSFRAVTRHVSGLDAMDLQVFVQRLSIHLTTWHATTFLIGEYLDSEIENNAVFTVADGILWLRQSIERSTVVRRLQVVKSRGQGQSPGLHTFRISERGLRVYPRLSFTPEVRREATKERVSTGVPGLDASMGGGIPAGHTVMVSGPTGSGKSILASQFALAGIRDGEPAVIAIFEKRPEEYLRTLPQGDEIARLVEAGKLRIMYLRPLDLSVEETMEELRALVADIGAKRVVIDSLAGFEVALAPPYRTDFRESLYRMLGTLAGLGVTVLVTAELVESETERRLTPDGLAFLADTILLQRYVATSTGSERNITVVKMRGSEHDLASRGYTIGPAGLTLDGPKERPA